MFIRLFALFFLFASFGASIAAPVPSATSVEISKRQESAVDILNTLKNSTGTILPKITTLVQGGNISGANVTSLITSLRTAIKTATSSLAPSSDHTDLNDVMTRIDNVVAQVQQALVQAQAQVQHTVAQAQAQAQQAVAQLQVAVAQVQSQLANSISNIIRGRVLQDRDEDAQAV